MTIPHTIGLQLVALDREGKPKDIWSRGAAMEVYGIDVCYVGPTPDGMAWFWVAPGDIRPLDAEQLETQGLFLRDLRGRNK